MVIFNESTLHEYLYNWLYQKNASTFFGFIKQSDVKTLIDVRLNNVSQLAGFAKRDDLKFFLKELCGTDYVHSPELAPTKDILNAYKKGGICLGKCTRINF